MVRLSDFEVVVTSPGVGPLAEFQDPDAAHTLEDIQGPGVVRYLLATPGEKYSIGCHIRPGHSFLADSRIRFYVTSDGDRVAATIVPEAEYNSIAGYHKECDGKSSNGTGNQSTTLPLTFGGLKQSDVDTGEIWEQLNAKGADIGTIKVVVERRRVIHKSKLGNRALQPLSKDDIPETALKGSNADMVTGFGPAMPCPKREKYKTEAINSEPRATFILKYRSRDVLERLDVMRQSLQPSAAPIATSDVSTAGRLDPPTRPSLGLESPARTNTSSSSRLSDSFSASIGQGSSVSNTLKRKAPPTSSDVEAGVAKPNDHQYILDTVEMLRAEVSTMAHDHNPKSRQGLASTLILILNMLEKRVLKEPAPHAQKDREGVDRKPKSSVRPKARPAPAPGQEICDLSKDD